MADLRADQLLPYDLLLEIFSYLPVKMILQLQLLSRPFRRLAANRRFRLLQSQRNLAASGVFIADSFIPELDFFPPNHAAGFPPLLVAFLERVLWASSLSVSSRGLLFYRHNRGDNFFVVNYACNEKRMIPAPPEESHLLTNYGLAVKFLDDDNHLKCKYQLVYLQTRTSSSLYRLCLYDSAAGEWIVDDMQVDLGSSFLNLNNLVVFEGSVFLASICYSTYKTSYPPYVAAIDASTRHVDFFPTPDSIALEDEIFLVVWEEAGERSWLCLVQYNECSHKFTLWRWSKGSMWVKFHEAVVDCRLCGKEVYSFKLYNLGTMYGMLLFFNGEDQAYAYSFKRQQFMQLEGKTMDHFRQFIAYTNSLQPCY